MNTAQYNRRVALVTGALGGIGSAIVVALMQRDFDVVATDRVIDRALAADLVPRANSAAKLACVAGDLGDIDGLPRFVDALFAPFGRIDVLVNNAGVSAMSRGDLLDVSAASYDLNFSINTRATFFLTQAVTRRMLEQQAVGAEGTRSVIFVSSSNAAIAAPERGEYAMSKAAVSMMARLYALRLAAHGIAVFEVRPGLIRTPMTQAAAERYDRLLEGGFTPINRWGTPEDVARAIATMAAGDLPFATGAAIEIDGGMHIHHY